MDEGEVSFLLIVILRETKNLFFTSVTLNSFHGLVPCLIATKQTLFQPVQYQKTTPYEDNFSLHITNKYYITNLSQNLEV